MTLISSELLPTPFREKSDSYPTTSGERLTIGGKFFQCGARRVRLKGITYGPFLPDANGDPFPTTTVAHRDLAQMELAGINALRTYHVPPEWFLELVSRQPDMRLLIDVPWSKHLCFLDSKRDCQEAREEVRLAASRCGRHGCVLGYSIGNEIPPDIVRWHGARRVERFLAELMDVAKQADSAGLVTFANYPPTEYLDLSFLDFATFNVYLHNHETFRRYLLRLQNLVGDRPLVLGELGMDSLRNGQLEQAEMLASHVSESLRVGLAGAFVFSWTDEWFTGKHAVRDWAFGITEADRSAKAAYYALREAHAVTLVDSLAATPRVSTIVCSYNGGATLAQCLESLCAVDYPDHEVILVDDGSTDNTRAIAARFPQVRAIHQSNQGLSMARNAGLHAATGEIVAYTDSDCFVDREWVAHLVAQLIATGAAAVGGPNLAPEDGSPAACVEASPGQPTHVLESDQVAEHVPGCNMAFHRDALLSINGFDPQFRQAGDDVDICWRLQQAGHWITFAPSAFVWHHRRQTPRAYLKQQAGYGRAEALLRFKHPHRFNARGQGIWRGVVYGTGQQTLPFDGAIIYRGTFGTGLFQCIYRRGPAHWAMIPSTLEWQTVACALLPIAVAWWPIAIVSVVMLLLSLFVAALQAVLANIRPAHDGVRARLLIMALCYTQPLVRSWARFHARYFAHRASDMQALDYCGGRLRPLGTCVASYWGTGAPERTMLLQQAITQLKQRRCGTTVDTGWLESDLEIFSNPSALVQVCTAQEELGAGERVIRIRYHLRLTRITWLLALGGVLVSGFTARWHLPIAGLMMAATLIGLGTIWYRGIRFTAKLERVFEELAIGMGLVPCERTSPAIESDDLPMMHLEPCSSEAAS